MKLKTLKTICRVVEELELKGFEPSSGVVLMADNLGFAYGLKDVKVHLYQSGTVRVINTFEKRVECFYLTEHKSINRVLAAVDKQLGLPERKKLIEEECEPITPENIGEALKYNGTGNNLYCVNWTGIDVYCAAEPYLFRVEFDNPKWLQHLELEVGKLKPLPKKKELTLEEALIELGFNKKSGAGYELLVKKDTMVNTGSPCIWKSNRVTSTIQELTYTTKEQLAKDITVFEEKHKFRPHWSLVDDGGHGEEIGKIYADEIVTGDTRYYMYGDKGLNAEASTYNPPQHRGKESDIGILCKNGSFIKAFWRGEE